MEVLGSERVVIGIDGVEADHGALFLHQIRRDFDVCKCLQLLHLAPQNVKRVDYLHFIRAKLRLCVR